MTQAHTTRIYVALLRDIACIFVSIAVAVLLFEYSFIESASGILEGGGFIGSFIAGIFFTSAFTIAPASVAFAKLAGTVPLLQLALVGGVGAVIGDMVLFIFIRDYIAEDIMALVRGPSVRKITNLFRKGFLHHLLPICGALIIASPLPDELGLAMLGIAKTRTFTFIIISYVMNVVGILAVGMLAQAL